MFFNADRTRAYNYDRPIRDKEMGVKLGSIVMVLVMFFIAKISFETAMDKKITEEKSNDRSPASIDQSYQDHLNKK